MIYNHIVNSYRISECNHMNIVIDSFFSKDAILRTCYKYADAFHFDIQIICGKYSITVAAHDGVAIASNFDSEFKNSLIDNELRLVIEGKTKVIKEALVCAALRESWSKTYDDQ